MKASAAEHGFMSILRRDDLNALMRQRAHSCVSIYLPTHRAMPETQQDPIRFKNLLAQAENKLLGAGMSAADAGRLLEPAEKLLSQSDFWTYQSDGLAIFVSPDFFRFYTLPISCDELVIVAPRFHLKQLLRLFASDGSFYVLALSQNQVRLFQGSRYSITELLPEGLPANLERALKFDKPQKQLQFHTQSPRSERRRAAVFHGHGIGADDDKERLLQYCREIDSALRPLLKSETAPLVLACVDYLMPIYRQASTYPHLMNQTISGNPESLSASQLHEQTWKIVVPHFQKSQKDAIAKYRQLAGTGRTSRDIGSVLSAACSGRIESLFVAIGVQKWGSFLPMSNRLELHAEPEPGDEDLLDRAAAETMLNGGSVFAIEPKWIPDNGALAATFRY